MAKYHIEVWMDQIEEWLVFDEAWLEKKAKFRFSSAFENHPDLRFRLINLENGSSHIIMDTYEPSDKKIQRKPFETHQETEKSMYEVVIDKTSRSKSTFREDSKENAIARVEEMEKQYVYRTISLLDSAGNIIWEKEGRG